MIISQESVLTRFWYPLAFSDELSDGPVSRRLLGTDLVLWLGSDGRPAAARDRCPHREAALSGGWSEGGALVCPYHGWQFGADGRCALIPQNAPGQRPNPRATLDVFRCSEALGLVWVCLHPDPLGGIPTVAEFGADNWRTVIEFDTVWPCAAPHLIDNNLDLAHLSFVHRGTFGDPSMPQVDIGDMNRTGEGLAARGGAAVAARPGEHTETRRDTMSRVCAPFTAVLHIRYPDGLEHIIVKAVAPIDDQQCRLLQMAIRNDTETARPAADIIAFDTAVAEEDRSILVRMPVNYPLELHELVHIDTDRASVAYRRLLKELVEGTWTPAAAPTLDDPDRRESERVAR